MLLKRNTKPEEAVKKLAERNAKEPRNLRVGESCEGGEMSEKSLLAVADGEVIALDDVPDEVFSSGMLGRGYALRPSSGSICAPVAGRIESVSEGAHAYTLSTELGGILIHIGIDTVTMEKSAITPLVGAGDTVRAAQPIARVDLDAIRRAGLDTVTPVVLTDLSGGEEIEIKYGSAEGGKSEILHIK